MQSPESSDISLADGIHITVLYAWSGVFVGSGALTEITIKSTIF
jgi:hypothetical protein